jgi:NAD(P)-dependent dehydrogenase (short-subunit alcohol dehydrogenase family)
MRGLRDKGVLISGGTSGIGLAAAERFLQEGSRVFVGGVNKAEVEAALETLRDAGSVDGITCDVSEEDGAVVLVDAATTSLGRVDVLINNAGIARKVRFLDLEPDEWDRMIAVNLRGMFLVARLVSRQMVADGGGGSIVNMASTNALGGEEEFAHYNASKGGVLQLTRSMAVELGSQGVRVNCLCPGFIDTPLNRGMADESQFRAYAEGAIPLGRYGRADEVAAAYAFLASDEASFVHGAALVVDGGQTAVM